MNERMENRKAYCSGEIKTLASDRLRFESWSPHLENGLIMPVS